MKKSRNILNTKRIVYINYNSDEYENGDYKNYEEDFYMKNYENIFDLVNYIFRMYDLEDLSDYNPNEYYSEARLITEFILSKEEISFDELGLKIKDVYDINFNYEHSNLVCSYMAEDIISNLGA